MEKVKCSKCGKIIAGTIKVVSEKKRVGKKAIIVVKYYHESCFLILNREKANEYRKQRRVNKGGSKK